MGSQDLSTASTFTIKELSGDQRTIELQGRALPYRPIKFSGTMAAEFTWYPGNPEATVQLLGAREDMTSIHGMWKNRFLGTTISSVDQTIDGQPSDEQTAIVKVDGVHLTDTGEVTALFDDVRRKGQLVEVTWDAIVRIGIMAKFEQEWERHQDVAWTCEFGWISQGDPTTPAVTSSQADLADVNSQWGKILGQVTDALAAPFAKIDEFNKLVNNVADQVVNAIFEVQDAVSSAVDTVLSPQSTVKRLAGIMSTLLDTSEELAQSCVSKPVVALLDFGTDALDEIPFGDQLAGNVWLRNVYDAARDSQALAAQQLDQFQQQINPQILDTFRATQDTDLRDVSTTFYGTPNNWKTLMVFNGMETSELQAGDVVFIPPAQTGTGS